MGHNYYRHHCDFYIVTFFITIIMLIILIITSMQWGRYMTGPDILEDECLFHTCSEQILFVIIIIIIIIFLLLIVLVVIIIMTTMMTITFYPFRYVLVLCDLCSHLILVVFIVCRRKYNRVGEVLREIILHNEQHTFSLDQVWEKVSAHPQMKRKHCRKKHFNGENISVWKRGVNVFSENILRL